MKLSWYQQCMPRIKDIEPHLIKIAGEIKKIAGVKSFYVWGSYAKNHNNPQFRVKDIDIIVKNTFHSGDLVALDENIIKTSNSYDFLEEQGFSPEAIKFSKELLSFNKYNIDHWAISADKKLLHWGPISVNKEESDDINKEAENYASNHTGCNRKRINGSSNNVRDNWYKLYHDYMNKIFADMPFGWYQTEDVKVKDILKSAIKL